jgi:hypothetical protein
MPRWSRKTWLPPRLLDVDADFAWALGLILTAVVAIILGWILLRTPPR